MWCIVGLFVAIMVASPVFGQPAATMIVPGRALGPVTLGMPAAEGRRIASRFEQATGCHIDLLVAHGVVIAAGSPWGGCLHLQLPPDSLPAASVGPIIHPAAWPIVGIGGPPAALVNAFGAPLVIRRHADIAILVFANGLVARVGAIDVNGGGVNYLAVQAPGTASVPRIGYFIVGEKPSTR